MIRRMAARCLDSAGSAWTGLSVWLRARPPGSAPRVYYGYPGIAGSDRYLFGGAVKLQALDGRFPNATGTFNTLYLVSSALPPHAVALAKAAKARGARLVLNQNGVAFPAWHGPGWEKTNAPMAAVMNLADRVLYQSEFCRVSADRFLGAPRGAWQVLHNAVDTRRFLPPQVRLAAEPLRLLLAGSHWQPYRVETAIATLAVLRRRLGSARLVIAGRFCWGGDPRHAAGEVDAMVKRYGVERHVEIAGPYKQVEAPAVLSGCHVLLHTKVNDPCPTLVLEAMSCGVPVAFSASGGVPELVGDKAGIGVASAVDWDRAEPPAPERLAEAIETMAGDLPAFSRAARERAVERFDVTGWLDAHARVFESVCEGNGVKSQ